MSLGYAEKLSFREDLGGTLGAPELFDDVQELERKIDELAQLVREAKKIVVFTGAGISTSCGIPDFRGPNGVWTLQRAGQPLPRPKVSFAVAKPSVTHQALLALLQTGKLTYVVSQNVDGLHLRSGIPRHQLAELHGNCFAESCRRCGTEYIRDFEVETVGFKLTGRKCTALDCGGKLRDKVLDWEDALPEDELQLSEQHAKEADLAICLGTSLQITPACNLPLKTIRKYKDRPEPGKLVIINLQKTKHDKKAVDSGGVVIHSKTDYVMERLLQKLDLPTPQYVRQDYIHIGHLQHKPRIGSSVLPFTVFVRSAHGPKAAEIPMLRSVEFRFPELGVESVTICDQKSFSARRSGSKAGPCLVNIVLNLKEAADPDKRVIHLEYVAQLQEAGMVDVEIVKEVSFVTQVVDYGFVQSSDASEGTALQLGGRLGAEQGREKKQRLNEPDFL